MKWAKEDGVLHAAHRDIPGIAGTTTHKLRGAGFKEGAKQAVIKAAKAPLSAVQMQDDFFKMQVYIKHLKGPGLKGRAAAAQAVADFLPNYSRMSRFEKGPARDVINFYGWKKWAGTTGAKVALKNPRFITSFKKGMDAWEREEGKYAPVKKGGIPKYLQFGGVTARLKHQPEKVQQAVAEYKRTQNVRVFDEIIGDDHRFAMTTMENPATAIFSVIKETHDMFNPTSPEQAEKVISSLGPIYMEFRNAITSPMRTAEGRDIMMRPPRWEELKNRKLRRKYLQEIKGTIGSDAMAPATAFIDRWANMIEIYSVDDISEIEMYDQYNMTAQMSFIPYLC
jgi:hypothetical protein